MPAAGPRRHLCREGPVGRGTGLGLATVLGIVHQAGGTVHLDSAPGLGTTVTVLLPAPDEEPQAARQRAAASAGPAGATILLVEDEAAVRAVTRRVLERQDFVVLEARHGADALLQWREHGSRVDALVTDVPMPEIGGLDLAARLRQDAPDLPIVFISGYADDGTVPVRRPDEACVEKPFTSEGLIGALHRVLGASTRAPRGSGPASPEL